MSVGYAIALAIGWFSTFLKITLLFRALLSWFPIRRDGFLPSLLAFVTEPFVAPIRWILRKSPLGGGMMDFSFIVVFILLIFLTPVLQGWARMLPF